jgi:hypothetical protein
MRARRFGPVPQGAIGSYRPYGTGRMVYGVPGNKLPGYDHLVPPGQSPTTSPGSWLLSLIQLRELAELFASLTPKLIQLF